MQRRVDLRWRMRRKRSDGCAGFNRFFTKLPERLNPKGALVYSTCSLEAEENREVVNEFLAAHTGYTSASEWSCKAGTRRRGRRLPWRG